MKLPAGKYWVGDPCYAISGDTEWEKFCEDFFNDEVYTTPFGSAFAVSTAYGDGVYFDVSGREYQVDSGMIGVVRAELFFPSEENPVPSDMHLIEFKEEFEVSTDGRYIFIGGIQIDTDPDIDDYDDFRCDFDDYDYDEEE